MLAAQFLFACWAVVCEHHPDLSAKEQYRIFLEEIHDLSHNVAHDWIDDIAVLPGLTREDMQEIERGR